MHTQFRGCNDCLQWLSDAARFEFGLVSGLCVEAGDVLGMDACICIRAAFTPVA